MIVASDLCRSGGASLKIPPILGSNGFFEKNTENTLTFDYTRPYMPPRC